MRNELFAFALIFGLGFQAMAQEAAPENLPAPLFQVWITKGDDGKPQYLMQGDRRKKWSLERCRKVFDKAAKFDPYQTIVLKVDRAMPLEPVQAMVKEIRAAKLKTVHLLFLRSSDAGKSDTLEMTKIKVWAKPDGIPVDDPNLIKIDKILDAHEYKGPYHASISRKKQFSPQTRASLEKGLKWLANAQNKNGSWGDATGWNQTKGDPELTGLALLAYLSAGHTPLSDSYGETVQGAMKWVAEYGCQTHLAKTVSAKKGGRQHAILSLALAESYRMTKIPFLQVAMDNAVDVIVKGQRADGAFNAAYSEKEIPEVETSSWNALALGAAWRADGSFSLVVGSHPIKNVTTYLKKSDTTSPRFHAFALTYLDASDATIVKSALAASPKKMAELKAVAADPKTWVDAAEERLLGWCFNTYLLAVQKDKAFGAWHKQLGVMASATQHKDGYWEAKSKTAVGRIRNTSLTLLALEVCLRYNSLSRKKTK